MHRFATPRSARPMAEAAGCSGLALPARLFRHDDPAADHGVGFAPQVARDDLADGETGGGKRLFQMASRMLVASAGRRPITLGLPFLVEALDRRRYASPATQSVMGGLRDGGQ